MKMAQIDIRSKTPLATEIAGKTAKNRPRVESANATHKTQRRHSQPLLFVCFSSSFIGNISSFSLKTKNKEFVFRKVAFVMASGARGGVGYWQVTGACAAYRRCQWRACRDQPGCHGPCSHTARTQLEVTGCRTLEGGTTAGRGDPERGRRKPV